MATAREDGSRFTPAARQPLPWHRPSAAKLWHTVAGLWGQRARRRPAAASPERVPRIEVLALVANHLANDLSAIRGYCELARSSHPDDETLMRRMDEAMAVCSEATSLIGLLVSPDAERSAKPPARLVAAAARDGKLAMW